MSKRSIVLVSLLFLAACQKNESAPDLTRAVNAVTSASPAVPAASTQAQKATKAEAPSVDAQKIDRVKTAAGDLEIATLAPLQSYELRFAGKRVASANESDPKDKRAEGPIPSVARSFGPMGAFDDVVLVRWDGQGNACNGYGFTFLGLKKAGSFQLSDDIPWCGGPDPVISVSGPRVTVKQPKHAPNRGTGEIPVAEWVYEGGRVTKK